MHDVKKTEAAVEPGAIAPTVAPAPLPAPSPKAPRLPQVTYPVSDTLRRARLARGFNLQHIANRLGISRNSVSVAELRELQGRISLNHLRKMAGGLDCAFVYALQPIRLRRPGTSEGRSRLRNAPLPEVPAGGWLHAVRRISGLSLQRVGDRVGICASAVLLAERSEVSGGITIRQLRRIADAMGYRVTYRLQPLERRETPQPGALAPTAT